MPNPSHHQTNKSQFAGDAGQWAVSKNFKCLCGSRGPHGPDLPSPCGQKFQFQSVHTCLMMGEASLETSPKDNMIQDIINSDNMTSTESTIPKIFKTGFSSARG